MWISFGVLPFLQIHGECSFPYEKAHQPLVRSICDVKALAVFPPCMCTLYKCCFCHCWKIARYYFGVPRFFANWKIDPAANHVFLRFSTSLKLARKTFRWAKYEESLLVTSRSGVDFFKQMDKCFIIIMLLDRSRIYSHAFCLRALSLEYHFSKLAFMWEKEQVFLMTQQTYTLTHS